MAPLVKICGLKTAETLAAALDAGADMVGFVFFPKSPRHIDLTTAETLGRQAAGRALKVALTVDADDTALAAIIAALHPDLLQLHGHETPDRVAAVRARFGLPVMKAIGVATADDLKDVQAFAAVSDRILFDAKPPKDAAHPGGNGLAFDWSLITGLDLSIPSMVSGGLDPANVAEALRRTGAQGVDVSSGVETAPGQKDPAKITAFVQAAKGKD